MKVNIGVEFGANLIQAAIISREGRLIARAKVSTDIEKGLESMVESAVDLIDKLLQEKELDIKSVKSIGVAIPGIVDEERQKVFKAHVVNLNDSPIQEEFHKHYNIPINVANDAHCAAIAESSSGAAENLEVSLTINVGTGICGGIIIDNHLHRGAVIGHTVVDCHGKKCYCGQNGCFETLCSAKALMETTLEIAENNLDSKIHQVCNNDLTQINVKTLWQASTLGDVAAAAAFQEYVENFAVALSNFANILRPDAIVICGGITALGENLLRPVREKVYASIYSKEVATLPLIKQSEMGSASVLVGAGMLSAYIREFER
jgi:glucokinase